MPTTFNVISLGNLADIDTTEGNSVAENASALVGTTFGGTNNALVNDFVSLSPGATGFAGGTATAYDQDNSPAETFSIDGGADQTFDSSVIYNATITYIDGTTATITAVVFQDTAGNTYLAPEFSANADQTALEAGAIRSLTLDSLSGNSFSGMSGSREAFDFVTCFTTGAMISTPDGPRAVELLCCGDLVETRDNGAQPVRWIGRARRPATGAFVPVRIRTGALGRGLPRADVVVSQQHRMLLRSKIAERIVGSAEVLVPAKKLLGLPGIAMAGDLKFVTFLHLLLDRHEIIYVEGAPTETLLTGRNAINVMGSDALDEIETLYPGLMRCAARPARIIPAAPETRQLIARHRKNAQVLLQS